MGKMIEIEVAGIRKHVDESTLVFKSGVSANNEDEHSTFEEWYLDGVLVKRNAHVTLKRWPQADATAGTFPQ